VLDTAISFPVCGATRRSGLAAALGAGRDRARACGRACVRVWVAAWAGWQAKRSEKRAAAEVCEKGKMPFDGDDNAKYEELQDSCR